MDARRRFLRILGNTIGELPVLRVEGFNAEPDEHLLTWEVDITLLYREYEALADSDKEAIEEEWIALGIAMDNANLVHFSTRALYGRIAGKLGLRDLEAFEEADTDPMHQVAGATRLTVVRNEADVELPTHDVDSTSNAVPVEVLDDVRQDERLEQKRGFLALLDSLGVEDSGDDATLTDDEDGDALTAGDVALTGLLYRNMYERFYGRPPARFDDTRPAQNQDSPENCNADVANIATALPDSEEARRPRPIAIYAAAVSLVAAVSLGFHSWQHFDSESTPATKSPVAATSDHKNINRSTQAGDVTMIVSHAEETADSQDLHVYVVNHSDETQLVGLSVSDEHGQAGARVDSKPRHVAPRAAEHRVLRVGKSQRKNKKSVTIEVRSGSSEWARGQVESP